MNLCLTIGLILCAIGIGLADACTATGVSHKRSDTLAAWGGVLVLTGSAFLAVALVMVAWGCLP